MATGSTLFSARTFLSEFCMTVLSVSVALGAEVLSAATLAILGQTSWVAAAALPVIASAAALS